MISKSFATCFFFLCACLVRNEVQVTSFSIVSSTKSKSKSKSKFNNNSAPTPTLTLTLTLALALTDPIHDARMKTMLQMNPRSDDDDDFDFARVRRRRGRGRFANDDNGEDGVERDRDTSSTSGTSRRQYDDDYDEINFEDDEDEDDEYDDDDDDDDDDYDDDYEDIIPNALLDSIDPDGAIDRLPELFADTQFWKDSAIWFFIGFLWLLNRFNNPMLNGVVDLDKVDFNQFYNQAPPM